MRVSTHPVTDQDDLSAAQSTIAELLSELSLAEASPSGVDILRAFEPSEVIFENASWLDNVTAVEDWLQLVNPIGPSSDRQAQVNRLCEELGGLDPQEAVSVINGNVQLTEQGLEQLRDRLEKAVQFKILFDEALEEGDLASASAIWNLAWEEATDVSISGPIIANSGVWPISEFRTRALAGGLELSPSYQRGDVWPTKDAQKLIESILRGIPLPSVILLRPRGGMDEPHEVVDGKQRLTAILRFTGAHPKALEIVKQADSKHPGEQLADLFATDYPKFRNKWKNVTGETLSAAREAQNYFPFKLDSSLKSLSGELANFRGKYFHEIRTFPVSVGGVRVSVGNLFTLTTDYKIPIIEYIEATPKQIHDVFNLYNKQGKHLNAEEIRNAVFHELLLLRGLAAASGDNSDLEGFVPQLKDNFESIKVLGINLTEYNFGDARYRKTKVLSWLTSMLLAAKIASDGKASMKSTAQQIDYLLDTVIENGVDKLRLPGNVGRLLKTLAIATDAHASADAWSPSFKSSIGKSRWQELPLVASLLGVAMAAVVLQDKTQERLIECEKELLELSKSDPWTRPSKTQTGIQWKYMAFVSLEIVDTLGVNRDDVDKALTDSFGRSSISALTKAALEHRPRPKERGGRS